MFSYIYLFILFYIIQSVVLSNIFFRFTYEVMALYGSAILEVGAAAVVTLLVTEPVGSFKIRSCKVRKLADWYPLLHNPNPNYEGKLHCTQEAVYPL